MKPKTKILDFRTRNPKQAEAAKYWSDTVTEQILYGGAKGGGKSIIGAALIFGDALIYPETHYFIARKKLDDLRKHTTPTIHEVFSIFGLDIEQYAKFNGQDNVFTLYNGSKVFLISCKDNPSDPLFQRFGSMQMTRGWIEEGGEIEEAAKENLWLSIGRWKNDEYGLKKKLLITCNPKKGWMKTEFVVPWQKGNLPPEKRFIPALATDNPHLSDDYLASLSGDRDAVRRQRLWEGRWDYDEERGALTRWDDVEDMFSNAIVPSDERYMTVDVARFGRDQTVVNLWQGLESYRIAKYPETGTDEVIRILRDFAHQERIPYSHILVDEMGVGGGIVDMMRGVKGFVSSSTPVPTRSAIRRQSVPGTSKSREGGRIVSNFENLKAQCAFKLAEMIQDHRIACREERHRQEICEDLSVLRQKDPDSDGKLKLIRKEDMKRELGRSPDIGDTFLMRAWFELVREATDQNGNYDQSVSDIRARASPRGYRNRGI